MKDVTQAYERVLARALRASDPPAVLAAAARNRGLPAALRRALGAVDPDGVRLAALLVTRLRFERLLRGSGAAEAWFHADPAAFTRAFGRYHRQIACRTPFPSDEARAFERWLVQRRTSTAPRSRLTGVTISSSV
jgi:hypothetical protein